MSSSYAIVTQGDEKRRIDVRSVESITARRAECGNINVTLVANGALHVQHFVVTALEPVLLLELHGIPVVGTVKGPVEGVFTPVLKSFTVRYGVSGGSLLRF